jgi:hypothetical protein
MRGFAVLLVGLAFTAEASAAPPVVTASASPASGVAPLRVTLTATGDAATYTWDLGDGAAAVGNSVSHVYAPGRHVATVTATNASGETAQAQVVVDAIELALSLAAPRTGAYEEAVVLSGRLRPARRGARIQIYRGRTHVTTATAKAGGRYRAAIRLRKPGRYRAVYAGVSSAERPIRVRPRLVVSIPATVAAGTAPTFAARLVPPGAGAVTIRVRAAGRTVATRRGTSSAKLRLRARPAGLLRVQVATRPRPGFTAALRTSSTRIVQPALAAGSRGPSVLALEQRLRELRYALRGVDTVYGTDTVEAVLAFQKVHGLPRTGRVDSALWRRLAAAQVPVPRYGTGDHIEIDKTRNVLYEVTGGRVNRIVHVSTGATGNTPLGTFHVYRKVGGWDWVLWYPMYFLRGFAIHGYPSVPAYPASHGCVRVPMWIAPSLFAQHLHGARIVVF